MPSGIPVLAETSFCVSLLFSLELPRKEATQLFLRAIITTFLTIFLHYKLYLIELLYIKLNFVPFFVHEQNDELSFTRSRAIHSLRSIIPND